MKNKFDSHNNETVINIGNNYGNVETNKKPHAIEQIPERHVLFLAIFISFLVFALILIFIYGSGFSVKGPTTAANDRTGAQAPDGSHNSNISSVNSNQLSGAGQDPSNSLSEDRKLESPDSVPPRMKTKAPSRNISTRKKPAPKVAPTPSDCSFTSDGC